MKSRFLSAPPPRRTSQKNGWLTLGLRSASSSALSFVSPQAAWLPKHVGRFHRVEITAWSCGACRRAGAAGWPPAEVHECAVFPRHTACLSGPQRVPSWFSSARCVITLADRARHSRSFSQALPVFPLCPQPPAVPRLPWSDVHCRTRRFVTFPLVPGLFCRCRSQTGFPEGNSIV